MYDNESFIGDNSNLHLFHIFSNKTFSKAKTEATFDEANEDNSFDNTLSRKKEHATKYKNKTMKTANTSNKRMPSAALPKFRR